jgi:hypothetical protein
LAPPFKLGILCQSINAITTIRKILIMNLTEITKITPLHTKDWYVKWCSSVVLIVAQVSTAVGVPLFPQYPTTMILYFIGILGWLLVAYWWHDRALIILNAIGAFIMASGILKFYMGV